MYYDVEIMRKHNRHQYARGKRNIVEDDQMVSMEIIWTLSSVDKHGNENVKTQ